MGSPVRTFTAPPDGRPPVERRVRAAHDLDAARVVDGEVDDARAVPRIGLRHAVDEQQRARELVAVPREPPQHDGLERTGLRAHDHARHVGDGLRQALVPALVDLRALDDVGLRRDLADAERRLAGRDLHALEVVGRRDQLDRHRRRRARGHLHVGDPQLEVAGRLHGERDGAGGRPVDLEAADPVADGRETLASDQHHGVGQRLAGLAGDHRPGDRAGRLGAGLGRGCRAQNHQTDGEHDPSGSGAGAPSLPLVQCGPPRARSRCGPACRSRPIRRGPGGVSRAGE